MKLAVAALVSFAIGCGGKGDPAAAGSGSAPAKPRPAVVDPIGYCERATLVIERRRKCFREDMSLKMALEEVAGYVKTAPKDPDERKKVALACAKMLDGMIKAEQPDMCPLDATDTEIDELAAFLAAAKPKE